MLDIKSTQTHCGQYKRYGDFFRVYEIETDLTDEEIVIKWCFENVYKRVVPKEDEYMRAIRYGTGEKSGDADYYFAGYYSIKKVNGGFRFQICEPYTD